MSRQRITQRLSTRIPEDLVLADTGILEGKKATTHWSALNTLRQYSEVQVVEGVRFVRDGNVNTSAGISAGIDLALEIVRELHGEQVAAENVRHMEYRYQ